MDKRTACCITALLCVVFLLMGVAAPAQDFIAAPESLPGGLSYQQWSVKWWQWVWSIPYSTNPIFDTTGADCGLNQPRSGVWFLAGTAGGDATRNCTIPASRMIFFPVKNVGNDYPCPDVTFRPGPKQSLEQFLTIGYAGNIGARQWGDHVTALSASLDGVPVQDLILPPETSKYRATSPIFVFKGDPSLAGWDPCVATGFKAVSDGFWIMLKPLTPGIHTLVFSSAEVWPSWTSAGTVTFTLTVVEE